MYESYTAVGQWSSEIPWPKKRKINASQILVLPLPLLHNEFSALLSFITCCFQP